MRHRNKRRLHRVRQRRSLRLGRLDDPIAIQHAVRGPEREQIFDFRVLDVLRRLAQAILPTLLISRNNHQAPHIPFPSTFRQLREEGKRHHRSRKVPCRRKQGQSRHSGLR
jgi:hypothetical protein